MLPLAVAAGNAAAVLRTHAQAGTLGVLLSPVASLEDLLAAAAVAKDGLRPRHGVRGRPARRLAGRVPEARRREPEPQGARARRAGARPRRAAVRRPRRRRRGGAGRAVWAVGTEIPDAAAAARLAGLEVLVAQAYDDGPLARTHVLLPAAPHSEMDGTFVNFEGRAQRFEMAYFPRGESRPHWALAPESAARSARAALRRRARRVRRARAAARRRARRLRVGRARLDGSRGSGSCRSRRGRSTGGSRGTAIASLRRPARTTGAASRGRRKEDA